MNVLLPAVSGQFYAGHPDWLRAEVAELLASAPPYRAASPKALIVPHAGYIDRLGRSDGVCTAATQRAGH